MAKYTIHMHEWIDANEKGVSIKFYRGNFCYGWFDVTIQKANAFYLRALRKGIIIPYIN